MGDGRHTSAREEAVAAIMAGEKSQSQVAREMGITRQAVSHWVQRYRERGHLEPRKRGRLRIPVLTHAQKLRVRAGVAGCLEAQGIAPGDYIPRRQRPPLKKIAKIIAEVIHREHVTTAFARRTAQALRIPHYLEPLEGFSEDFDYPDEQLVFERDWVPEPPRRRPRLTEESAEPMEPMEPMAAASAEAPPRKRRRGRPPKKKPAPDPDDPFALEDDDIIPEDIGAYKQWVKETKAMMAKHRGDEAASATGEEGSLDPGKEGHRRAGVRTGKHAKGRSPTLKRKKKGKKRR